MLHNNYLQVWENTGTGQKIDKLMDFELFLSKPGIKLRKISYGVTWNCYNFIRIHANT